MSTPAAGNKTLAIRISPDVHAQLAFIAQLRERTINDEGLAAILAHLVAAKDDSDLIARATAAREAVEREAKARQDAISQMFGTTPNPSPEPAPTTQRSRRTVKEPATDDNS